MPNYHIPKEHFIKVYQESNSLKEVSEKTGLKEAGVRGKANRYRAKGIELKQYIGGTKPRVSDEDFIKIWNTSSNIHDVAILANVTTRAAHQRHRRLVKNGILLNPLVRTKAYTVSNKELISSGFGYWLCGLIDGEGHIGVDYRKREARNINGVFYTAFELNINITITLRDDDLPALEYLKDNIECGYLNPRRAKNRPLNHNPVSDWRVANTTDLVNRIIPIVRTCGLRTKKRKEFELWLEAVEIKANSMQRYRNGTSQRNGARLTEQEQFRVLEIMQQLKEIRRYK